jgi:hypothetical protein
MPRLTFPLVAGVPVMDLQIAAPTPSGGGSRTPVRSGAALPALVDTGAKYTCVDAATLATLGIVPTTATTIRTASSGRSPQARPVFEISLVVPLASPLVLSDAVAVVSVDLSWSRYRCLVGRDILARCRFEYDGPAGLFTLEF